MEEPGRLQTMGSLRVRNDWATSLSLSLSCIGEGNDNPLQCSCLENPRDGGALWAAVYGVAQSRTRLKPLSSSSSSRGGFPGDSVVKNLPANAGEVGLIPGTGISLGGGHGNPLQYCCLGNPMNRGVWRVTVHAVANNQTWLGNLMITTAVADAGEKVAD